MFETQLAQIAATIPAYDFKIPGQPKILFENVNMVSRGMVSPLVIYQILTMQEKLKSTGVQPQTLGFKLAWGRTPTR
jgi:hypothetical protein